MKLLIDEDLSPTIARHLCEDLCIDAVAVRDRGLLGSRDDEILEYAFNEDRILVTANVGDFEDFAQLREVHAGIIFICDGGLLRDEQITIVKEAIEAISSELKAGRDMINRVLYIGMDGTQEFRNIP